MSQSQSIRSKDGRSVSILLSDDREQHSQFEVSESTIEAKPPKQQRKKTTIKTPHVEGKLNNDIDLKVRIAEAQSALRIAQTKTTKLTICLAVATTAATIFAATIIALVVTLIIK